MNWNRKRTRARHTKTHRLPQMSGVHLLRAVFIELSCLPLIQGPHIIGEDFYSSFIDLRKRSNDYKDAGQLNSSGTIGKNT